MRRVRGSFGRIDGVGANLVEGLLVEHEYGSGVVEHESNTSRRVGRVDRCDDRTETGNGKDRDDHVDATRQCHCDNGFGFDAASAQYMSGSRREHIQLAVADASVTRDECGSSCTA